MRKLIVHMTITVDGFIAKPDGTLWEAFPWPEEMQEFTNDVFRRVDTAVYGRLTYEAIVPWWADVAKGNCRPDVRITEREIELANVLQGIRKVVVSRTMEEEGAEAVVIRGDVVPAVAGLKEDQGRDIVLHGGSGLVVKSPRRISSTSTCCSSRPQPSERGSRCSPASSENSRSGSSRPGHSTRRPPCSDTSLLGPYDRQGDGSSSGSSSGRPKRANDRGDRNAITSLIRSSFTASTSRQIGL